jgi:hypothetical protein
MKRVVILCSVMFAAACGSNANPSFEFNDASSDGFSRFDTAPKTDSGKPTKEDTSVVEEDTAVVMTDSGTATTDTTVVVTDTATPPVDTGTKIDTGPKPDTGTTSDLTTGKTCVSDDTCDVTGDGINVCSKGAFSTGDLYPTAICIGVTCDPGTGNAVYGCDGDLGICIPTTSGGICLPMCEFSDSTTAPTGCAGKNKCNAYSWGKDATTMAPFGVGYCFGGCKADADCPTGNVCQVEDGLCVKTKVTYTKSPGDACTDADAKAPAKCNCLYTTAEKKGYCANVCYFGETTCGTGFTCDASLPRVKLLTDDVVFTKVPTGIAGYCLKNCTTDSDCTALNGYCEEMAGTGKKTCQLGKRPCAKSTDCPTGVTCTGATATTVGRCG